MSKVLILYAYSDNDEARKVLKCFMQCGMDEKATYYLIINGDCSITQSRLAKWDLVIKRENVGYDFEAWRAGLLSCNISDYDYFICLNDTVIGPYVHPWIPKFTDLITSECLLSGISVNCCTYQPYTQYFGHNVAPHVQSMLWCTNRQGLDRLWEIIMKDSPGDKNELVIVKEIGMSMHLLKQGYNIAGVLATNRHDYRDTSKWDEYARENPTSASGDPWYPGSYYGGNVPYPEAVFVKRNRGIYNIDELINILQTRCYL